MSRQVQIDPEPSYTIHVHMYAHILIIQQCSTEGLLHVHVQAFNTEYSLVWEWGEFKGFDVATDPAQLNHTLSSCIEFCLDRTLLRFPG